MKKKLLNLLPLLLMVCWLTAAAALAQAPVVTKAQPANDAALQILYVK